jgi:hypothetical protein
LQFRTDAIKALLLSTETSFIDHFQRLGSEDEAFYIAVLLLLVEQGVDLPGPSKAKILAALWARKRYTVAEYLLARPNYVFGLPEVLRAVKLLDLPRRIRSRQTQVFHRHLTQLHDDAQAVCEEDRAAGEVWSRFGQDAALDSHSHG